MNWFFGCLLCAFFVGAAVANSPAQDMPSVVLHNRGGDILIEVQSRRPLEDTLQRLCQEYGWLVDFEEIVYTDDELIDVSAPAWRKTHPRQRGAMDPPLQRAKFTLPATLFGEDATGKAIEALLIQYNEQFSQQRYEFQKLGKLRFVVYGVRSAGVADALNAVAIVPPTQNRLSASSDLDRVVQICSANNRLPIVLGNIPINGLTTHLIAPSARKITCREAIDRIANAVSPNLTYRLAYEATNRQLFLSITSQGIYETSQDGRRTLRPRN